MGPLRSDRAARTTVEGEFLDGALTSEEAARIQLRLGYLAWRRYRIPADVAEDLVQAALLTYLEVRDRYPNPEEHQRIIVGIFRNKCREHIDGLVRGDRKLRVLRAKAEAGQAHVAAAPVASPTGEGVVDELAGREEFHLILQALAELRPGAREMLRLVAEDGVDRKELIRRFGLNKNTLDSRLHTYRKELRKLLTRHGIDP